MANSPFNEYVRSLRAAVEAALVEELTKVNWPESLKAAVEYSLMAGGKRLRPILVLMANEVCGGTQAEAIPAACAVEMIHTYSLIHDDLPAMDDDDFRRGRPASHKVFGEALAILAGDCLLTLAFETITSQVTNPGQEISRRISEQVRILAAAAGGSGMVGGQVLDLEAERGIFLNSARALQQQSEEKPGYYAGNSAVPDAALSAGVGHDQDSPLSSISHSRQNTSNPMAESGVVELGRIHTMKTGALIAGALEIGAATTAVDKDSRSRLREFGHRIGLAFQITDDLLDVTGDEARLGKKPGRDADLGKLTYPGLLGIENSRSKAEQLVQEACAAVASFGDRGKWLKELARFILERDH